MKALSYKNSSFSKKNLRAFFAHVLGSAFIFLYVLCNFAEAKVQEFATFSVDMPSDWRAQEDKNIVTITHPQNMCVINVMVVPHLGVPFRELGIAFYQNLKGKNVKGDDGGMSFELTTENAIPGASRLSEQGEYFTAVTAIGQCKTYETLFTSLRIRKEASYTAPAVRMYPVFSSSAKEKAKKTSK